MNKNRDLYCMVVQFQVLLLIMEIIDNLISYHAAQVVSFWWTYLILTCSQAVAPGITRPLHIRCKDT